MKTNLLFIIGTIIVIVLQSCNSIDDSMLSDNQDFSDCQYYDEVVRQYLDAGFKIAQPEDSLMPNFSFDNNKDALEYLEYIKTKRLDSSSAETLSRGSFVNVRLKNSGHGLNDYCTFSHDVLHVDIFLPESVANITNKIILTSNAYQISISSTPLPLVSRDKSATYRVRHVGVFNYVYIVLTEKYVIDIKGLVLYDNVDVTSYDCGIDFENMTVGIEIVRKG